jgi:hydroxypyruvate reductase
MLAREVCERAFEDAVKACDPEIRVRDALARNPVTGTDVIGLAVGKAALAMARGAGPVARGLVVAPFDDSRILPPGWRLMIGAHPVPDARSEAAADAAIELVESARVEDHVLALISGGASSLIEKPLHSLDQVVRLTGVAMARGMPIAQLNFLREQLSTIKGGRLADRSLAPVTTLVVSDVIGDDARVVGSGPTVSNAKPARVEVVAPMRLFGEAMAAALGARRIETPVDGKALDVAAELVRETGTIVAWGEPVVVLPEVGFDEKRIRGGRAQHLALELAKLLRGTDRAAFVAGSDGIDGTTWAAGAFVTGETWDAIANQKIDPEDALRRCDSTRALLAVDALVITGPTGINHADVIVIG